MHSRGVQGRTAEQLLQRSLEACRQDIEDEHLEVEGVIGQGRRGTVFWGSWRGLEVAIKSFEFEARFRSRCTLHTPACSAHLYPR